MKIPPGSSEGSDLEAERGQRVSRDRVLEHSAKALHRGASEPCFGHDKIIVLVLCRDEAEPVLSADGLDRDPPIGAVLRDGDTDGIVRLRLRPVTRGFCASGYAVRQDAGAAASVAVAHQAIRPDDCAANRALEGPPLEARVALAVDDPLQAAIAGDELQRGCPEAAAVVAG